MRTRGLPVPEKTLHSLGTRRFEQVYRDDRVAFLNDCISFPEGQRPSRYQLEIAAALDLFHYVAVKGPRRLGKSTIAAWMTSHAVLTHHDIKVITIAPSWRQLSHYLWPEIHKWVKRIDWSKVGRGPLEKRELLTTSINLSQTQSAFAVASDRPELVEGAHAAMLAMVYDEAKSIPDPFWDAVEGSMAGGVANTMGLAISTPGMPMGRFYDIFAKRSGLEYWHTISVSLEAAVEAGRISDAWVERRRQLWGENSVLFRTYVLGEFGQSEEVGLIPMVDVEAAIDRWKEWEAEGFPGTLTAIGVDVGGGLENSDLVVLAPIIDHVKVGELQKIQVGNRRTFMMDIVGHIGAMVNRYSSQLGAAINPVIVVDMIGMGLGVYHRLNELGFNTIGFNASVKTNLVDRTGSLGYSNARAAMWGMGADILQFDSGINVCLPPDDSLLGDLIAPRIARVTSASEIVLEDKASIKRRINRSTDCGDAVLQGLVGQVVMQNVYEANMSAVIAGRSDVIDPGLMY